MRGIQSSIVLICACLFVLAGEVTPQGASGPQSDPAQSSSPQAPGPQKGQPVYESATVLKTITRLVVVDVVATDKNGPVRGLSRENFTILEDGKPQQIRVFNFQ